MSSLAPISAPPSGALPTSTHAAEALPRPLPAALPASTGAPQAPDSQADQAAQSRKAQDARELQKQLEHTMADSRVQTNLRFRVDEDARRIVVSVVDSDTGETILQIPDEAALAVARRLAETGSGLLDQQA